MTARLRLAAAVGALGSFLFLVVTWLARPFVGGDTPFVLDGTNAFLTCVKEGVYHACGYTGELNFWGLMSGIGWWPLLQHIPDLIALGLGADGHAARTRVLAALSVVGVVASVGLGRLVLVLARRRDGKPILRHVVWGAVGMAVTITAASLFNEVRFGSVLNTNYLDAKLRTPGLVYVLDYSAAVVWSPSGGLFWFWPAATVLVALACLMPFVVAPFRSAYARPAVVLICVIGALAIGFAAWWTPFGWTGYGRRLQLP